MIAGTQGRNKIPDGCWYQLVEDALAARLRHRAGRRRRRRSVALPQETRDGGEGQKTVRLAETRPTSVPDWLRSNASSEISGVRTVTPSSAEEDAARAPACGGRAGALLRGSWCTGCCSRCRISRRKDAQSATAIILPAPAPELAAEERAKIAEEVDALLEDARFCRAFRARQPRRSADRRQAYPRRQDRPRLRPDRPPGGDANLCADCRFQDQPAGAAPNRGRAAELTYASSRSIAPC